MAPILNMYFVWVYVEQGKSLNSKMLSFFENFVVSRANTPTEEGVLSAKVVPVSWVPIRREPWRPDSRRIWQTGTTVTVVGVALSTGFSPRAPALELSAKNICTVGWPFAESGSQNALGEGPLRRGPLRERGSCCSLRREPVPRAGSLALGEASGSRWRLYFR
jgi:hypothetical protein